MRLATWFTIATLIIGTASGCGPGTEAAGPSVPNPSPRLQAAMPFESAPFKAQSTGWARSDKLYGFFCYSGSQNVNIRPVPDDISGLRLDVTTTHAAQGIAVGENSSGEVFVIVLETDYAAKTGSLHCYTDTDNNGMPESESRTIAQLTNVGLCALSFHAESGTLYVVDIESSSVLQFQDTNADKVPDDEARVFISPGALAGAGFEPTRIQNATATSVEVVHKEIRPRRFHSLWKRFSDSDGDGLADTVQTAAEPVRAYARISGAVRDGATTLKVYSTTPGTFSVRDENGTVLGSVVVTPPERPVLTLVRPAVAGEALELLNEATQDSKEIVAVVAANTTLITGEELIYPVFGGSFTFYGEQITGGETVEARLTTASEEDGWTTCVVTGHTLSSLTISVPVLAAKRITVFFRIRTATGGEWTIRTAVNGAP